MKYSSSSFPYRMLTLIDRLGDSLTDTISKWDPLLQMITEGCPSFLVTLTEIMADELAFTFTGPSSTSTKNDPYCEGVYTWLDHVLRSTRWELHRRHISVSYVLAVCEESSNHWTALLKKSIGEGDSLPTVSQHLGSQRESSGESGLPDADDDMTTLHRFGWDMADTWDSRPLGVI